MGELAVSRAFGDSRNSSGASRRSSASPTPRRPRPRPRPADGESPPPLPPPPDRRAAAARDRRLVVAEPELRLEALRPDDAFILLACDGLFDVFSDAEAVDVVRTELADRRPQRGRALSSLAIVDRGSRDNVTVVIVKLGTDEHAAALLARRSAPVTRRRA